MMLLRFRIALAATLALAAASRAGTASAATAIEYGLVAAFFRGVTAPHEDRIGPEGAR